MSAAIRSARSATAVGMHIDMPASRGEPATDCCAQGAAATGDQRASHVRGPASMTTAARPDNAGFASLVEVEAIDHARGIRRSAIRRSPADRPPTDPGARRNRSHRAGSPDSRPSGGARCRQGRHAPPSPGPRTRRRRPRRDDRRPPTDCPAARWLDATQVMLVSVPGEHAIQQAHRAFMRDQTPRWPPCPAAAFRTADHRDIDAQLRYRIVPAVAARHGGQQRQRARSGIAEAQPFQFRIRHGGCR